MHQTDRNRIAEYDYDAATGSATPLREYVWMNGQAVAVIEGSAVYYVRTDHIGRPVFATDGTGAKVWEASYLPFGGVHTTTGTPVKLRFPGQWFQSESGLHQNWMRDYDPTLGRYIQADPLELVDGASVYGYALQNPGRYVDPYGGQAIDPKTGHQKGGPYHPPKGVRTRCKKSDSCSVLRGKKFVLNTMINSHVGFDRHLGFPRHGQEITDLKNGLNRCRKCIAQNCSNCPPGGGVGAAIGLTGAASLVNRLSRGRGGGGRYSPIVPDILNGF